MFNPGRICREFGAAVSKAETGWGKFGKLAALLAPLLVIIGAAKIPAVGFAGPTIIIVAVFAYAIMFSALVGWCFARSIGPEIEMSDPEYDPEWSAFFVRVTSRTNAPTIPSVLLGKVADTQGNQQLAMKKTGIECRWRDYDKNVRPSLPIKGAMAQATILKTDGKLDDGRVFLRTFLLDRTLPAVSNPVALDQRETLHVTIVATCTNDRKDHGNTIARKFELSPIQGSPTYRVRRLRH